MAWIRCGPKRSYGSAAIGELHPTRDVGGIDHGINVRHVRKEKAKMGEELVRSPVIGRGKTWGSVTTWMGMHQDQSTAGALGFRVHPGCQFAGPMQPVKIAAHLFVGGQTAVID